MKERIEYTLKRYKRHELVEMIFSNRYVKMLKGVFITFLAVGIFFVIYFPNYAKLKRLRQANQDLSLQNQKLKKDIIGLENKLRKGDNDAVLYEKFARDYLGVARDGEIVIDIKE